MFDKGIINHRNDLKIIPAVWECFEDNIHSYFLSWGWVECWLQSLPEEVDLRLIIVGSRDRPQAAFFIGNHTIFRKGFISKGLFLNSAGSFEIDSLCIEYNTILRKDSSKISLMELLSLLPKEWDEFYLPGLSTDVFPGSAIDEEINPYKIVFESDTTSPFVDLDKVRAEGGDYLRLLSSNTRGQIRKAEKRLKNLGEINVEQPKNLEDAFEIYDELVSLHNSSWQKRGQKGAFASAYFHDLHRELIRKRFKAGEVQLLRIKAGNLTLGCLYNFVFKGTVYFYQSGINYEIDGGMKPGIMCQVEAVKLNAAQDHRLYDFMAGGEQYKMSLATGSRRMVWVKVPKPVVKFLIEDKLKFVKRKLEKIITT